MRKAFPFSIIGFLIGIPISYYFQPGIIQFKFRFSLSVYLTKLPATVKEGNIDYIIPLLLSCFISAFIFSVIGAFLDKSSGQQK